MSDDTNKTYLNGYDLPVKGLDNGFFYPIHISALIAISISFICAVTVLVISIRKPSPFFNRAKNERFVVYLAICDGMFNVFHSMDHLQYLVTLSHPSPPAVCAFYSFMMFTFVMSQMICVNVIAINAFFLMYFGKNLNFGKRDYRLLLVMFGVPLSILTVSAIIGKLGPNGYFCAFDGVTGGVVLILFTIVPSVLVLLINSVLYVFIWNKLRVESKRIMSTIGKAASSTRATHRATKTMMLFIVMFVIQWTASSIFGLWELLQDTPPVVVLLTVILANSGGSLNGIVFLVIHRRKSKTDVDNTDGKTQNSKPQKSTTSNTNRF